MTPSLNLLADLELLTLIGEGDEAAFVELYQRHWKKLYNEAFRRLGDIEKSKDIIQDVFLQFWQRRSFEQINNVIAYLKQAVRFQVIKAYNESNKFKCFELPMEILSDDQAGIEEVYFAKELEVYITAWLSLQPERRKRIFYMRFIEHKNTKEIGEELNISQKTVQKTLFIALSNLKESLSKLTVYFPLLFLLKK